MACSRSERKGLLSRTARRTKLVQALDLDKLVTSELLSSIFSPKTQLLMKIRLL